MEGCCPLNSVCRAQAWDAVFLCPIIAKYPQRREREKAVALARRDTRGEDHFRHLLFPDQARAVRASRVPENNKTFTMCGDFCAMERGVSLFASDIAGDKLAPPQPTC